MSTEDKIREWESHLSPEIIKEIEQIVDEITQHMDFIVQREEKIDRLIKLFIQLCDRIGLPPEMTSSYINHKLKGIVSEDTVRRHLPKERKRKYDRVTNDEKSLSPNIADKKEIEVSSGGSESYSSPEEPEPKEPQEDTDQIRTKPLSSTNQASEKEELETRLSEALKLADDKDRALERERIKFANLEVELGNKAKPPSNKVDANEELQIKYDELKQAYDELLEVERLRTSHSDFKSAAALPKQAWIAAINVFGLSRALTKISMNLDSDSSAARLKVLFDVTSEGQIKNPRLEGDVT